MYTYFSAIISVFDKNKEHVASNIHYVLIPIVMQFKMSRQLQQELTVDHIVHLISLKLLDSIKIVALCCLELLIEFVVMHLI